MLDSGYQSPGFRIPQAKISWIPESGFPYMGREFTDPKFEEYIAASTEATLIIQECVVTQSQRSLSNDFLT